jgi:hypothetical protein
MKATFGEFIRQTRAECATALGYAHRASMHRLEKGEREWTLSNIGALARMLNLKMSELLQAYEQQS